MERIHENVHVLCFHVKQKKYARFVINFSFSAHHLITS